MGLLGKLGGVLGANLGGVGALPGMIAGGIAGNKLGNAISPDAPGNPIGAAQMLQGATPEQQTQTYDQAQQGIGQQQAFVNALQAQNGIGNQSAALSGMQGLEGQMAAANGVGNQSSVFAQQQGLANQLQGLANGQGPNPAQAALAQATGNNVANQAALMAGQRGAGSNVGLMARQAAQQGAATQQQAVGQGATMQAQQQIAAMNALQGQQANMGNLASTQVGQRQQQQGMAGNLATQQVGQQQGALNAYNQAAQSLHGQVAGNIQQQNATTAGMQQNMNNIQAAKDMNDEKFQQDLIMGGLKGIGSAATMGVGGKPMASGGMVPTYAEGGVVGPSSKAGQYLKNPQVMMAQGGPVVGELLAAQGKVVPGKAKVKGDSLKNDTVEARLSPGEVVIPRSVMQSKDPAGQAAKFVQAVLAKQGLKKK